MVRMYIVAFIAIAVLSGRALSIPVSEQQKPANAPMVTKIFADGKEFARVDIASVDAATGESRMASYYISTERVDWDTASSICYGISKNLVTIVSKVKNDEVKAAILAAGASKCRFYYIGAKFKHSTNNFIWDSTSERLSYSNWIENSAYNFSEKSAILIFATETEVWNWANTSPTLKWNFICE